MVKSVEIICKGRVQGVFFRASTKETADALDLKGWVQNEQNGSVRILVIGDVSRVNQLVDWCKKGPRMAKVDEIEVSEILEAQEFPGFEIRY